jgi:hypothetical protein
MTTQREQDGWLPDPVQQIANAAARCGLVPLVEVGYDRSISLRDPADDHEVGVVAEIGGGLELFVDVEDGCITIAGAPRILAWLTRTTGRYAS